MSRSRAPVGSDEVVIPAPFVNVRTFRHARFDRRYPQRDGGGNTVARGQVDLACVRDELGPGRLAGACTESRHAEVDAVVVVEKELKAALVRWHDDSARYKGEYKGERMGLRLGRYRSCRNR